MLMLTSCWAAMKKTVPFLSLSGASMVLLLTIPSPCTTMQMLALSIALSLNSLTPTGTCVGKTAVRVKTEYLIHTTMGNHSVSSGLKRLDTDWDLDMYNGWACEYQLLYSSHFGK